VITPLAVEDMSPCPLLPGLRLHLALVIATKAGNETTEKIAVVPVPTQFSRFVTVPSEKGLHLHDSKT